jgi:hypothetical protein
MATRCTNIQLLDPCECDGFNISNPSGSLSTEEGGALSLSVGVTEYVVPFTVQKLNSDYDFIESDISNTVDEDPMVIGFTLTERTATGFKLQLDSAPDTGNSVFRWKVQVTSI